MSTFKFIQSTNRLGTSLATVPAEVPTFHSIRIRLKLEMEGSLKIGVAWAGRPTRIMMPTDRSHDFFNPLFELSGSWISLQIDSRHDDVISKNFSVKDLRPQITDFADTAAAIMGLDLVITVDTAVAHLAGALGKDVWILLPFAPDWRWLTNREDSPWYPSARLFRQTAPHSWRAVIDQVKRSLIEKLGG